MGLDGVREAARKGRDVRFTALMHHITPDLLTESFMDLKRSAAAGVGALSKRAFMLASNVSIWTRSVGVGATPKM